jgi:pimeloyl-ACP methyl ester carboxylesterase
VQIEILRQLTSLARSGMLVSSSRKLSGSNSGRLTKYKPTKIIHVGHSLGSVITLGLITSYPTESDGVIATGFLHTDKLGGVNVGMWGFEFARDNDPVRFRDRGSGYLVQATRSNTQLSFFKKGSFEKEMLDYAWKIRQPNTVSEFLSIGTALGRAAPGFKAPLQVRLL